MNPYLENASFWHDFHQSYITYFREALSPLVRPNYMVKIDDHLYIHEPTEETRRLVGRSNVSVVSETPTPPATSGLAVLTAPVEVHIPEVEAEHSAFLEIRDRDHQQLITVIELLSPSNKNLGDDRKQYLTKRGQLLTNGVHLVEIDLLRGGPRMPVHNMPECDYCVLVGRAENLWRAGLWPIRLRERLPVIPIPLRRGDADARVDLQSVLHRTYDAAGYEPFLYRLGPVPPLSAEDAAWASQFVPSPSSPPVGAGGS
jgi:hypothetical protein